jgi:hypothetical protein
VKRQGLFILRFCAFILLCFHVLFFVRDLINRSLHYFAFRLVLIMYEASLLFPLVVWCPVWIGFGFVFC